MLKIYKIGIYLVVFTVNILTRLTRVKNNRITFISYRMDDLEDNFKFIASALNKQGVYDNVFLLKKYDRSFRGKFKYFLNIIKQAYYFNTSKIILLDGNNIAMKAIIKKKNVTIIQVWHACGALKKFGEDAQNRLYQIKSCDYAVTSGQIVAKIYSRVLNVPQERVLGLGIPRTDSLFLENQIKTSKNKIFNKFSIASDKRLILYAPTFRGKGIDDMYALDFDYNKFKDNLPEDCILAMRYHPMIPNYQKPDCVIDLTHEELEDVLCAADMLVTDYSSIIFEYSILERPMVFYCPDLEEYKQNRGFYVDFDTFIPGKIAIEINQLNKIVNDLLQDHCCKEAKTKHIKETYFDFQDGKSTERILKLIEKLIHDEQIDLILES